MSDEILAFLSAYVRSLDELRILAALCDDQPRWWDARAMAAHIGVSVDEARRVLEAFGGRNLLDIRISDAVRYQLRAGTPELDRSLQAFIHAYRRSPTAVTRAATEIIRAGTDVVESGGRFRNG